jgi:hypothetical protein
MDATQAALTALSELIAGHGEKAVLRALAEHCSMRAQKDETGHGNAWGKLAYRLSGAFDGMRRGQFGAVK